MKATFKEIVIPRDEKGQIIFCEKKCAIFWEREFKNALKFNKKIANKKGYKQLDPKQYADTALRIEKGSISPIHLIK